MKGGSGKSNSGRGHNVGKGPEVGERLEQLKGGSWAGEKRARWWFLLSLSQTARPEQRKALGPPLSQAPVIPTLQGLPFITPKSPSRLPVWGRCPLGEAITAQKSRQSPSHGHNTQLGIVRFFPSLQTCHTATWKRRPMSQPLAPRKYAGRSS